MSTIDRLNRFVKNPVNLDISRSKFNRPFTHKTTFKSGVLIPLYLDEVLPGDTFKVKWSSVVRMLTPAVPVMDNAFMDLYFFFVPFRLCTQGNFDWQKIQGENFSGPWAPATESTLENTANSVSFAGFEIRSGSVANYLGLPIKAANNNSAGWNEHKISLMPFNAYAVIWNEWFRDQNTQVPFSKLNAGSTAGIAELCKHCRSVNKLHDYFTSVLPEPQKGDSVLLPLGTYAAVKTGTADVFTGGNRLPMKFRFATSGNPIPSSNENAALGVNASSQAALIDNVSFAQGASGNSSIYPTNLYADLSDATAASVNQLRQAFAIQRLLEKDARGGTRYREMLKAHFGVTIPDLTVQVPEYLGGKRFPLNITQVLQTSQTSDLSPLGATGAFSNTAMSDYAFIKSFNEYGYIMCVGCVRTEQSYSQGIPKFFTRNRRYDFYLPVFANLGEQPVYKRELFAPADMSSGEGNAIFGYQEAWAEYRYHANLVTGNLAPNAGDNTMTAWTYTNKFTAQPTLNSSFMNQPSSQIGDTLVVTDTETQFVGDFFFDIECTRPMPLYSIPGLIDHH